MGKSGERPKVVINTFGTRTANPRDALEIIATGRKPLADLLDTLEAVPAVGGGALLIVLFAEIVEALVRRSRGGRCARAERTVFPQSALYYLTRPHKDIRVKQTFCFTEMSP